MGHEVKLGGAAVTTMSAVASAAAARETLWGEVWCNLCWYLREMGHARGWKGFVEHLLASDEEINAAGRDLAARFSKFRPWSATLLRWPRGAHRGRRGDRERGSWCGLGGLRQ